MKSASQQARRQHLRPPRKSLLFPGERFKSLNGTLATIPIGNLTTSQSGFNLRLKKEVDKSASPFIQNDERGFVSIKRIERGLRRRNEKVCVSQGKHLDLFLLGKERARIMSVSSKQSADSDCNENPEDDVAELCDGDYDVAEDECAGNNVAETDSEQFGLRNIPLSEKENNNSPNSGTDDDADDIPLSE
ncbi:hypothetical protein JTB14_031803 [Gonioctena quinquepunctata]|nr:hypothetical protein JTB14_031803 [Gonioctena quinquepunctata]